MAGATGNTRESQETPRRPDYTVSQLLLGSAECFAFSKIRVTHDHAVWLIDLGYWKVMGQRMSKSRKYVFSKKYMLMFVFCLSFFQVSEQWHWLWTPVRQENCSSPRVSLFTTARILNRKYAWKDLYSFIGENFCHPLTVWVGRTLWCWMLNKDRKWSVPLCGPRETTHGVMLQLLFVTVMPRVLSPTLCFAFIPDNRKQGLPSMKECVCVIINNINTTFTSSCYFVQ